MEIVRNLQCNRWNCTYADQYRTSQFSIGDPFNTEDVWLARQLFANKEFYEPFLPSFEVAALFSTETIYSGDPIFMHKAWHALHLLNSIELLATVKKYYMDPDDPADTELFKLFQAAEMKL